MTQSRPVSEHSQGSSWGEPDTLEAQARVFGDQVVVAVVVKDTTSGLVRAGRDHDVDRRQAVMAAGSQLPLAQQGTIFHHGCYLDTGKQKIEFIHHLLVIGACASRVSGLKQKRQADRKLTLLEPAGHRLGAVVWQSPSDHPRPSGVV